MALESRRGRERAIAPSTSQSVLSSWSGGAFRINSSGFVDPILQQHFFPEGDQPNGAAELIDHDGEMQFAVPETVAAVSPAAAVSGT